MIIYSHTFLATGFGSSTDITTSLTHSASKEPGLHKES